MRFRKTALLSPLLLAGAACACVAALPRMARADTNHVREFAKNKPRVLIVTSGPQAAEIARSLQAAILRHGDNKHPPGDVPMLSLSEAAQAAAGPDFAKTSIVFLLAGKELGEAALPATLASALPFDSSLVRTRASVVQSAMNRGKPGEPVYTIALAAPDADRLRKVYEVFLARQTGNFRDLPFAERFTTNRVAVFSAPEDQSFLNKWGIVAGANVWNEVRWYPLAERAAMLPEQLEECAEVYFLDRSRPGAGVPEAANKLLAGQSVKPTTVLVARGESANGCPVLVVSTPSRLLLQTHMERYPNAAALATAPLTREAADLRKIGSTTLLVPTSPITPVSPEQAEGIHLLLAKDMRERLQINIEPRGAVLGQLEREVTLQSLQGATDTARKLRRKLGTRYVWLFTLTQFGGDTTYRAAERKITPDLAPFTVAEPEKPTKYRKESDDDFYRRLGDWRDKHASWERDKREHNERYANQPCDWQRSVTSIGSATAKGLLQLVDMDTPNGAKVVWEKECHYTATEEKPYRSDRTTVRGHDNRPDSLDAPPAGDRCTPALMLASAQTAGNAGLSWLREEAWLPERGAVALGGGNGAGAGADENDSGADDVPAPARSGSPQVAAVEDGVVTLTIGARQGVRIGDRVVIAVKTREITDPATGKVLETRVLESVTLRVTQTGATADCVPATAEDAARLAQITPGMPVQWTRAASAPPRPAIADRPAPTAPAGSKTTNQRATSPRRKR